MSAFYNSKKKKQQDQELDLNSEANRGLDESEANFLESTEAKYSEQDVRAESLGLHVQAEKFQHEMDILHDIKTGVDSFADEGRLYSEDESKSSSVNENTLSSDSSLLDFVASVSGDRFLKIDEDFGMGFWRLKSSEAERRQAKHDIRSIEDIIVELLRNARDANSTKIFIASSNEAGKRSISVIDDGDGVPAEMRERIFEPRVTSKLETMSMDEWGVHGRGMALYSIRQNVEFADLLASVKAGGSSFKILSDPSVLKELADQSKWPKVINEAGEYKVESGPHNLIRKVVEFAIRTPHIEVYFGSPSEIVASLYSLGQKRYKSFAESIEKRNIKESSPLWHRLAEAKDANELVELSAELGLEISARNAYRILRKEIKASKPVLEIISKSAEQVKAPVDIFKDARGLKLEKNDVDSFAHELEEAFEELAQKYYLSLSDDIKVKVLKDSIKVTFPFERE